MTANAERNACGAGGWRSAATMPAGLSERDRRLDAALAGLYDAGDGKRQGGGGRRGGLGGSAPRVASWLGDIREFFPASVVQVIQKDAFERLGLKQMLLEPEFLAALEADVHLVADLIALRSVMPEKTKATAREVVAKVVKELMEKLESAHGRDDPRRRRQAAAHAPPAPCRHRLAAHHPQRTCATGRRSIAPSCRRRWSGSAA